MSEVKIKEVMNVLYATMPLARFETVKQAATLIHNLYQQQTMKTGLEFISEERGRQVAVKGMTTEADDLYVLSELTLAAVSYALPEKVEVKNQEGIFDSTWVSEREEYWPFHPDGFHPTPENRIKELSKAGALIAAEIDRLIRNSAKEVSDLPGAPSISERDGKIHVDFGTFGMP